VAFLCMFLQGPVVCVTKVGPLLKLLNAYAFIRLLSPHMCPRAGPLLKLLNAYAFIRLLSPHMCPRAGPLMRLFS